MIRALALVAALSGAAMAEGARPRAASTTLCGDLYLLSLADDAQIALLSPRATGPNSPYADRARAFPVARGGVEALLGAQADLLILSHGVDAQLRRVMGRFRIAGVEIESAAGFDVVRDNVRRVAAALDQMARGEALIDRMRARLAELAPPKGWTPPRVVYYRPDGGGAGAGTFVSAAIEMAGYRNIQLELGPPGWGGVPLEAVVMNPPDGFITSYFDSARNSVRATLGRNPVLKAASARGEIVTVPGGYWPCAHPILVEAVATLAEARGRFAPESPK